MKKIITLLLFLPLFSSAQNNPSGYDKNKQDPRIDANEAEIITLKSENSTLKNDVAEIKRQNAELKKGLDSFKVAVMKYSSKFILTKLPKDTIYIDIR